MVAPVALAARRRAARAIERQERRARLVAAHDVERDLERRPVPGERRAQDERGPDGEPGHIGLVPEARERGEPSRAEQVQAGLESRSDVRAEAERRTGSGQTGRGTAGPARVVERQRVLTP